MKNLEEDSKKDEFKCTLYQSVQTRFQKPVYDANIAIKFGIHVEIGLYRVYFTPRATIYYIQDLGGIHAKIDGISPDVQDQITILAKEQQLGSDILSIVKSWGVPEEFHVRTERGYYQPPQETWQPLIEKSLPKTK